MDIFAILGIALGLAMLAGINLYLTIFLTGIAVTLGKVTDAGLASSLEGFSHPAVIAVALGLFVVQFIIDKIPWVDSLWDSIHTFLKPAGGVLLAVATLGPDASNVMVFFVAVLALVGSLLTHWIKAGARLSINTSPEPFSNIGASVCEDLLVVGGAVLVLHHPAIAFIVFAILLAAFIYLTPRVTRSIRAILWLIWRKVRVPASDRSAGKKNLPSKLKTDAGILLLEEFGSEDYKIEWCVSCLTGKTSHAGSLSRNIFGELVAIRERPGKLFFLGKRNFKKFVETIQLDGTTASHESRFLCEEIVIHNRKEKRRIDLRFHRGQEETAAQVTAALQSRIAKVAKKGDQKPSPIENAEEPEEPVSEEAATSEKEENPNEKPMEKLPGIEPEEVDTEKPEDEAPEQNRSGDF